MKITPLRLALVAAVVSIGAGVAFTSTASAQVAEGRGVPIRIVQIVSNLTDEQRQCLEDAGITRPGADATPEERQAAREAFRTAAETCGITLPDPHGPLADLTDEQKACLDAAGLTRPDRDATFEERKAAREALKAAAEGCGITLPERPAGAGNGPLADLTDEQTSCLEDAGVTRPGADATVEERQAAREALKAAAEGCGITLPERPAGAGNGNGGPGNGGPGNGNGNGPLANLTDEQKSCLQDAGLTRPGADATVEERQAAREARKAAAESCGIELPARPAA